MKNLLFGLIFITGLSHAQPIQYDVKLGADAAEQFVLQIGQYSNPKLHNYVNEVGFKLVAALSEEMFEYTFTILDDPTPNAFALPGGFVFVTRGLLALVQNVDELACVIAHEIVHVQKRHSVKQMKRNVLPNILLIPGKILEGIGGGRVGKVLNAPIEAGTGLFTASYSRKHESEADKLGVILAARAGFDPSALPGILERIIDWEESLNDTVEKRSYYSDHPYTPDRTKNINKIAPQLEWTANSMHDKPISEVFDDMLFWNNPKKGVFVQNKFIHPPLDISITFPEKWHYFNHFNSVGGLSEDRNRVMVLSVSSMEKTPTALANEYIKEVEEKHRKLKIESKAASYNGLESHYLKITESLGRDQMNLYMIWMRYEEFVYKLTALSPIAIDEEVEGTAGSFQPVQDADKEKVTKYEMKFVSSDENEAVDKVATRNNNILNKELLLILNGMKEGSSTTGSEVFRVVQELPYFE